MKNQLITYVLAMASGLLISSSASAVEIADTSEICKEALTKKNFDRRNALIRLKAVDGYITWLFKSPPQPNQAPHYIAVVFPGHPAANTLPKFKSTIDYERDADRMMTELKELDSYHYAVLVNSPNQLPTNLNTAHQPEVLTPTHILKMALNGLFHAAPYLSMYISPYLIGEKPSLELLVNKEFWAINLGVMSMSWWVYPTLRDKLFGKETQVGRIIKPKNSKLELTAIYNNLNQQLQILKAEEGTPVYAILTSPEISNDILATLLEDGYQLSEYTETDKE